MLFFTLFSPTLILLLFLVGWFLGAAGEVRGHWASTVREEAEDGRGAAEAPPAAGEVGGEGCGWLWPWPWELVRWRRHLNDPACVAGAHTHLAPPPPPWLPEEALEKLRRIVLGDDAAAPVGVVLVLWWPWNLPSSPVVST
uniref:Uncharacterized protein n=1 Tax=Oryza barthii TaxID=65489 RepID=A0A0D3F5U2_9ORYZ